MERIGGARWAAAARRSTTSACAKLASQSTSGAVMTTSTTSSIDMGGSCLQLGDNVARIGLAAGHGAPAGHDGPVVAEADPSAGHGDAVRVKHEVHRSL